MLIDTDVLIAFFRGNKKAFSVLNKLDSFAISSVVYMELVQGMQNKNELQQFRKVIKQWPCRIIHISESISSQATFYVEQYYLSGNMMLADALIAATATIEDLTLITGNMKHYRPIKELKLQAFKH